MHSEKILIIDDNKAIVTSIEGVLKKEGYATDFAFDGYSAIKKALSDKYDLILLDITLPDIDGFEVLKRLNDTPSTKDVPVIFISVMDNDSIYQKGFDLGVMDYLKKPIPAAELIFRIKNYLRIKEMGVKLRESELFFKSVVEDQTEFVVRYTPERIVTFANTAFCKYLNRSLSEIIGNNILDLLKIEENDPLRLNPIDISKPLTKDILKVKNPYGKNVWILWTRRILSDKSTHQTVVQAIGRDITEIQEREIALRIWEKIFKNASWGIATFLPGSENFLSINEAYARMHGYTAEELEGRTVHKILVNSDIDYIHAALNKEGHYSFQCLHRKKDGEEFMCNIDMAIIKDENWKDLLTVANVTDISPLIKTTEALKESEEKFRLLADYNYDWEFWLGPDNKYIYISPSCERISGYKAQEFINNPDLMMDIVHPDDKKRVAEHIINEYRNTGTESSVEFMIIDKSGNERWISHSCNPVFDDKGNCLGRRGNNLDITIRKKSEKELLKLSTAVKQSSSAIIITNTEGIIEYVNPYFENLTGYSASEAIGNNPNMLKSGKTDPKVYKGLWSSIIEGKIWEGEFINKKKNSEIFTEHAIISPVKDENGKTVNYVAIKQDITKQKEIDRKILQAVISTEEKERIRFARDLHDDLGPLLSTAKLYIKSFETATDEKNKGIAVNKSLKAIDEAIMSIKEISNNISPHILRNFGLISGINSFVNKINDTNTLSISFVTKLSERFDENIESSIFRIVAELVNNTIKHAQASKIYINLNKIENDLMLIYSDDGVGFQIENALNKEMSRGLSNIFNRVDSLGGEIELDSAPNKGFNVFIHIPVPDQKTD